MIRIFCGATAAAFLLLLLIPEAHGQAPITLTPLEPSVFNENEVGPDCCTYSTAPGVLTFSVRGGIGPVAKGTVTMEMPATVRGTNLGNVFELGSIEGSPVLLTVRHALEGVDAKSPEITVWPTPGPEGPCISTKIEPQGQFAVNSFKCEMKSLGLYQYADGRTLAYVSTLITIATAGGANGLGSTTRTFQAQFTWAVGGQQDIDYHHAEAVQVAQTADLVSAVPLVFGKTTAIRVFMKSTGATSVIGGFSGTVIAEGLKGLSYNFNSPIAPALAQGTGPDPDNTRSSLNFILDQSWTKPQGGDGNVLLHVSVGLKGGPRKQMDFPLHFEKPPGWPDTFRVAYVGICAENFDRNQDCANLPPDEVADLMKKLYPVADGKLQYVPAKLGDFKFPGRIGAADETDAEAQSQRVELTKFVLKIYFSQDSNDPPDQVMVWIPAARGFTDASTMKIAKAGGLQHVWWGIGCAKPVCGDDEMTRASRSLARGIGYNLGLQERIDGKVGRGAFDARILTLIPSSENELMSSTPGGWLSSANYQLLYDAKIDRPSPPPSPKVKQGGLAADGASEYLIIGGTVAPDGNSAKLDPGYRMFSTNPGGPSNPQGTHCLRFSGGTTTDYCFTPFQADPRVDSGFMVKAPFPAGTTSVAIVKNEPGATELTAITGTGTPSLQLVSPQTGDSWEGKWTIQWTASDPDSKPLVYAVQYSADNGASWMPLALDLKDMQFEVDGAQIAGGSQVLFRVLASNGLNTTTATVGPLTVTQSPKLAVDITSLDFRNVTLGQFADRTVTVSNSGSGPLTVNVQLPDGPFGVLSPASSSMVIPAGRQGKVSVRFAPQTAGTQQATLVLTGTDPNQPVNVTLAGAGFDSLVPNADATPASLDFGTVSTSQSKELPLTVLNNGSGPLSVTSLTSSALPFTITSPVVSAAKPLVLDAGQSALVAVRFAPGVAGALSEKLTIGSDDPSRPKLTVALAGTGVGPAGAPSISVAPATLDFGSVVMGQSKDLTVTISNKGASPLTVASARVPLGLFTVSPASQTPIPPGGQQILTVKFTPTTTAGTAIDSLLIASNDLSNPSVTVPLKGTGAPTAAPTLSVTPTSYDFGTVALTVTKELPLTVRNIGTFRLVSSGVDRNTAPFTISGGAFGLDPGQQTTVTVRFAPVSTSAQSVSFGFLTNNSANDSIRVSVSGNTATTPGGAQTIQLALDDGVYETAAGFPAGTPTAYFVNRITPPSYPATLRSVQIAFLERSDLLKAGDTVTIVTGANANGSSNITSIALASVPSRIAAVGQFNSYDVAPLTIQSGDFVVGFWAVNPPNVYPAVVDTSSQKGRSYVSTDGKNFTLIDTVPALAGNLGIRATVEIGGTGGTGGTPGCLTAPSNKVSWWTGDGNANDSTGTNNGTLLGGASFGTGKVGQAFQFNGSTGYVSAGNPANLRLTSAITIDAWINPSTGPTGTNLMAIATKWAQVSGNTADSDSYGLWLTQSGGAIHLFSAIHQSGGQEPHVDGGVIPLNSWTHVAMTFDSTTGQYVLYVNGQPVASLNSPGAIVSTSRSVFIGREDSSLPRAFNGLIDEVEVFSRALTAAEIQAIFNAGSAGQCKTGGTGGGNAGPGLSGSTYVYGNRRTQRR